MSHLVKYFLFLSCFIYSGFVLETSKVFEWTAFRGSNGTAIDTRLSAPASWDSTAYLWHVDLVGEGSSSPVVWGNQVFVSSSDNERNTGYLCAYNSNNGSLLWQKEFELGDLPMHPDNAFAAASPAVDGSQLYIIWYSKGKTSLVALDHQGVIQWETEFGGIEARHGGGSSLVLSDANVIFTREQEEGSSVRSSWVAVDKETGSTAWELERETCPRNSFSTPILVYNSKQEEQLIFTSYAHGVTGVDAVTGQVLWEMPGILKHRVVGSPVYSDGLIVGCYKGGGVALDVDLDNKQTADSIRYAVPRSVAPYVPSPIIVDDFLFLFMDSGVVSCLELKTGKILWKERPGGPIYGSPICVGNNLYCISKDGKVIVITVSPMFQLNGIYDLGEGSFSTPAMSMDGMVFRTFSKLMLLGNSKG